eukprot:TRINITY_DN2150_c0_g1_i1.p1 TRINITY_DN2150_c0_g1~~TRINITY_DN2150_c0_g1_i1.p1  ORF type:complete len:145 (-),score=36.96 TRINITY_DN2150_c0_g1_i1:108-542(-)
MQVYSRLLIACVIAYQIPDANQHFSFTTTVGAWSLSEIFRYLYYAFHLLGMEPYALLWLRYSLFIFCYPIGATSEWVMMYVALPFIQKTDLLSIQMPNKYNAAFSLYYFIILNLIVWPYGLYIVYTHMWRQRAKNLSPQKEKSH